MKEAVLKLDPAREFFTDEGCYIIEVSNNSDDPELSIARARVEPGITTSWHRLNGTAERYYMLSGRGRIEMGGSPPREMAAGDVALIPPMIPQRISNTGPDDLIFLAICTPRFSAKHYEDLEAQLDSGL